MRIDWRLDIAAASLHVGEKAQQRAVVVTFREALLVHKARFLERLVGQEEAVRRDELDFRRVRPARQERLQHARRRRLADGDRAGDADDVGDLAVFGAQKTLRRLEEPLRRRDIEREQARKREIDLDHFFERDRIVQRLEARQILISQGERRVGAQLRPFGAREMAVGRGDLCFARRRLQHGLEKSSDRRPSRPSL